MAQAVVYKCPNCGAGISYSGESEKMTCEYCDSEIDVSEFLKSEELKNRGDTSDDFDTSFKDKSWNEEECSSYTVYTCSTCGAELITDANTAATRCIYCSNPTMIPERLSGVYRPELVIPFKTTKNDALSALNALYKNKPLLPREFKDKNKIESIEGIYLPFWIFSADTDSNLTFRARRVHHWSDSRYNYTKTDHYRLYRNCEISFHSIPADGSKKTNDDLTEALEPFGIDKAVSFDGVYLSGFMADKYDVEPSECRARINERISNSICDEMMRTAIGYVGVTKESSNIRYPSSDVKYVLLPVWMLVTQYKGKQYTFAMNGETGKAVGDLPVGYKKFWGFAAGITAILGTLFSVISWLL